MASDNGAVVALAFGSRVRVLVGMPEVEVDGVYVGVSDWPGFLIVRVDGVAREVEAGKVKYAP
jgi:hypothetical protein